MSRRHLLWLGLGLAACAPFEDPEVHLVGTTVTGDAYDDGRLNPGDAAEVQVEIQNTGGEPDTSMTCTVTGGGQGVAVDPRDDSLNFGYCRGLCDSRFRVTVDPEVLPGTKVYFNCDLSKVGTLSMELEVSAPDLRPEIGRIVVTDDATQDGVLNPGESATLNVTLANPGSAAMSRSTCVVGSDTAGVEVLSSDDDLVWSSCAPESSCGTSRFRVQVAPDVLPGTMIDWRCDLVDAAEAIYPLTFRRRVEAPAARPRVLEITVDDDGDEDGVLDPGETATLAVHLVNAGRSKLPRATCVVDTDHAWAEVLSSDDDLVFSDCGADGDCGTSRFRARVEAAASPGSEVLFNCTLEDSLGAAWPLPLRVTLGG